MDSLKEIFSNYEPTEIEPPKGHSVRFEKKLKKVLPIKNSGIFISVYAAAIVILLIFSLNKINQNNSILNNTFILTAENEEIIETEHFLKNELEQRLKLINSLYHKEIQSEEMTEFYESLSMLKNDYNNIPGDQRIVDAVLNTYLLKIETLDNLIKVLQMYS